MAESTQAPLTVPPFVPAATFDERLQLLKDSLSFRIGSGRRQSPGEGTRYSERIQGGIYKPRLWELACILAAPIQNTQSLGMAGALDLNATRFLVQWYRNPATAKLDMSGARWAPNSTSRKSSTVPSHPATPASSKRLLDDAGRSSSRPAKASRTGRKTSAEITKGKGEEDLVSPGGGAAEPEPYPDNNARSAKFVASVNDRDHGRCVFTSTAWPEAAHIVPHAGTKTSQRRLVLKEALALATTIFGADLAAQCTRLFADSERDTRSEAYNGLCLSEQLHTLLDKKGAIILRCAGISGADHDNKVNSTVQVPLDVDHDGNREAQTIVEIYIEFLWLGRPTGMEDIRPDSQIDLENKESQKWIDLMRDYLCVLPKPAVDSLGNEVWVATRDEKNLLRYLESGHTATLRLPKAEAENMKAALDFTYALALIGKLAGAGERDDVCWRDDDDSFCAGPASFAFDPFHEGYFDEGPISDGGYWESGDGNDDNDQEDGDDDADDKEHDDEGHGAGGGITSATYQPTPQ